MARQVLPIVGAAIGGYFGGPAGAQAGYMIGSVVGNAVDPQIIKGPSIGDGVMQTSKEGVPRPIIHGTACIAGNLIDRSEIRKWKKRTKQGKGGPVNVEERMSLTFAIRICEGPIAGIRRVWEDEKLVYDVRPEPDLSAEDSARYAAKFRFFNGSEDQLPSPALEKVRGAGNVPSYRGTAYIVFDDLDVTDRRGSVPNFRFEVFEDGEVFGAITVFSAGEAYDLVDNQLVKKGDIIPPMSGTGISSGQYMKGSMNGDFLAEKKIWAKVGQDYLEMPFDINPLGNVIASAWNPVRDQLAVVHYEESTKNVYGSLYDVTTDGVTRTDTKVLYQYSVGSSGASHGLADFSRSGDILVFNALHRMSFGTQVTGSVRINSITKMFEPNVQTMVENLGGEYINPSLKCHPLNERYVIQIYSSGSGLRILDIVGGISITDVTYQGQGIIGQLGIPEWGFNGNVLYFYGAETTGGGGIRAIYLTTDLQGSLIFRDAELVISDPRTQNVTRVDRFEWLGKFNHLMTYWDGNGLQHFMRGYTIVQTNVFEPYIADVEVDGGGLVVSTEYSSQVGMTTLGRIVRDIAIRTKVDPNKIAMGELADTIVRGFMISGTYNSNNVLRSLQDTYLFDPAEFDGLTHLVPRGLPVVATIHEEDLIDEPTEETRENAREYPQKLELFYQNPDVGYTTAKATSERISPDYQLSGTKTMETPVTLIVDEAWQLADKQMKVSWEEAKGNIVLKVSSDWDFLTPTDCIGFIRRGVGNRLRIHKVDKSGGVITLTCKFDRESAYRSDVIGLPVIPPTPPPSSITGETIFQFLNIPALVDNLDILHYYYGATGTSDAWYGAVVERRVDDDEFSEISRVSVNSRMGLLVDPLPYSSEYFPDTTNSVVVQMFRDDDDLVSLSNSQLLREQNAAAISREDGTAEIIQFRDVEDLGERRFRLSYMLRGRLNSIADSHAPGAVFTFLDDVTAVPTGSALIGAELDHRATSFNESPENSEIHEDIWQPPLSQLEWPVDQLKAVRNGNELTVTWSPRERFGTDVNPIRSMNWQAYRVTFSSPSQTYTVDVQNPSVILDVSGWSQPVTVSVSQVNRITGPGPSTSVQEEN